MVNVFCMVVILCIYNVQAAFAEIYRYVDRNGTVQIPDNLNKVSADQRTGSVSKGTTQKTEMQRAVMMSRDPGMCREDLWDRAFGCRRYLQQGSLASGEDIKPEQDLLITYRSCSHPLLEDLLTAEEKNRFRSLAKQAREAERKLTAKELDIVKVIVAYVYASCARMYTMQDKDELQAKFHQIWQAMAVALEVNDIEKAVSFWHPSAQDTVRNSFIRYSAEKRKRISREMRNDRIVIDSIDNDMKVICRNISTRKGKQYSPRVIFVPALEGEWLIDFK